jgi:ubiquinone/menaquinone biosynthesis C-methylase UbiE
MNTISLKEVLGNTDMYLIDLVQKGYFDNPLKILDIGCGSGRNMTLLARLGHELSGYDSNDKVISELKSRFEIEKQIPIKPTVGVGELGNLDLEDNQFDFLICNAVLHFAKNKAHFESMVIDMVRVLKSGGVLFARFVSSHTLDNVGEEFNKQLNIADGSVRFVVDYEWLKKDLIPRLGLTNLEAYKTVNIDHKRSMTTVVLRTK